MPSDTFLNLRDEKQEAILRSAVREFAAKGYTKAKVEDIAAAAGVSKGSIFTYFGSKKALLLYTAEWGIKVFMDKFNIDDVDVFNYFDDFDTMNRVIGEERELAVFYQVIMQDPSLKDEALGGLESISYIYTKKLIQNGKKLGTVRGDIPDDILVEYFLGVTMAFDLRWSKQYLDFKNDAPFEIQETLKKEVKQMKTLIGEGLSAR